MNTTRTTSFLAALLTAGSLTAQDGTAVFEVTFQSTWSATTHPVEIPSNPHYSRLIGATHDAKTKLWTPGGLATDGIEAMAEAGSTGALSNEIHALITNGGAKSLILGTGMNSPASQKIRFVADASHPHLTIVTMVAPSPDWFCGLDGLALMENGRWIDAAMAPATVWDAGTDSGVTYTSADLDTNPPEKIAVVTTSRPPFKGYSTSFGTWSVQRIASTDVYGCGVNPQGSMQVVSGEPLLGKPLTFAVHDPLAAMPKGSRAFLLFSLTAAPGFPCGIKVQGFGMSAPGAHGEVLLGSFLATLPGAAWSGSPVPFALKVPDDASLNGAVAFVQGGLAAATRLGLADAVEVRIGM